MEFTFVNILLVIALVAISILLGRTIGYKKGRIDGLSIGRESTREYFFKQIPKDVAEKILKKEKSRLMAFINGDDNN